MYCSTFQLPHLDQQLHCLQAKVVEQSKNLRNIKGNSNKKEKANMQQLGEPTVIYSHNFGRLLAFNTRLGICIIKHIKNYSIQ
jgi:hypothetical protein